MRVYEFVRTTVAITVAAFSLSACNSKKAADSTRMTLVFPQAKVLGIQNKPESSSGAFDFAKACFAISVTASDITSSSGDGICDIPVGIFYGFVAPGASVSLMIPSGAARKLEVFAYTRTSSTDSCPSGKTNLKDLELERLTRVGLISSFDVSPPEITLTVNLTEPSANLATQYALPDSCQPASQPPATPAPPARPRTSTADLTSGGKQNLSTLAGYKGEISVGHVISHIRDTTDRGSQGYFSIQGVSAPK